MIEELAKAAYESIPFVRVPPHGWEGAPDDIRECYMEIARAVLTRLREPTPGMVEAGALARQSPSSYECAIDAFRAMIDAAMEGK